MAERVSDDAGVVGQLPRWLLTLLRIAIGWHFLYEGHAKFFSGSWTSAGYLDASRWFLGGAFHWMASHPAVVTLVDAVNIGGQIVIGLLLITGTLTRAASLAAVALLALYYLANPPLVGLGLAVPADGHYLVVDRNLIEMLTLAFIAALPVTALPGVDRWFLNRQRAALEAAGAAAVPEVQAAVTDAPAVALKPVKPSVPGRREMIANLASLPFLGAFAFALFKKRQWASYEERNLVDAVTAASTKTLDVASLRELKGTLPKGKIGDKEFSRLILGGNLLSGWAHSRDLIYVSQLVKAYHNKERIFATLLVAEKCGVNTLLTNPILCTLIDEYWKRRIGKMQFISDCAGLDYDDKGPHPMAFDKYLDKVQRAIDYGAAACYIQGETADYYVKNGQPDRLEKVIDLIRKNKVLVGIGAHHLETLQGCVAAGMTPDFWMKTMHHHGYWSARHPEWHDNMYCNTPQETMAWMRERPEPWIAFKVMAAGAIHPKDAFRYAYESGADFVCAGMYDFQMVEDVNIALDALGSGLPGRERPWMA
jgi:uncharacterized membrane protein YphA (DoxX/SURF4 family)